MSGAKNLALEMHSYCKLLNQIQVIISKFYIFFI